MSKRLSRKQTAERLRAELVTQRDAHGHVIWLPVAEADAIDLASGHVPTVVKARVLNVLDQRGQDERRAARPYRKKARK